MLFCFPDDPASFHPSLGDMFPNFGLGFQDLSQWLDHVRIGSHTACR